jgi:hypothetical protein
MADYDDWMEWQRERVAQIFHSTADVFRRGWRTGWPHLGPLSAKQSYTNMAAKNFFTVSHIPFGFSPSARSWGWTGTRPASPLASLAH